MSVDPPFQELQPEVVKGAFLKVEEALDAFAAEANVVPAARQLQARLQEQNEALGHQRITVTARIAHAEGRPPKSVSIDLGRLGIPKRRPLLEVAGRSEAASGETVYANTFSFGSPVPGLLGLNVAAVADDGSLAGAVGVLGIQQERAASVLFSPGWTSAPERETGGVTGGVLLNRREVWFREPRQQIGVLEAGPWSVRISGPWQSLDLSRFYAVSFLLSADGEITDDLAVAVRDHPTYAVPTTTNPVFLIKEGFLRSGKITTKPQRVTIPVSRLIKDSPDFQPSLTRWLILSGKSSGPVDIFIHALRCYPTADAIPTEEDEP